MDLMGIQGKKPAESNSDALILVKCNLLKEIFIFKDGIS